MCAPVAQGLLCGVLQVIVQKLSESDATKAGVTAYADAIMEALLRVFACHPVSACHSLNLPIDC